MANTAMPTGESGGMNTNRRHAVAALVAAGLLWGSTVPLSKLALEWLAPGWLTAGIGSGWPPRSCWPLPDGAGARGVHA